MKILVIGYGSIGKRHTDNLLEMGHEVKVVDVDSKRVPKELQAAGSFTVGVEVVFICTPTSSHLSSIETWRNSHLFIEKPLAATLAGLKVAEGKLESSEKVNMVACNMRFEPLIQKARDSLKEIGEIYSVKVDFGYYLPYWSAVDYKNKEHPGVALDCVHDLDVLSWFHGNGTLLSHKMRKREFGIPSIVEGIVGYGDGTLANIHLDYHRRDKKRVIEWVGSKGSMAYIEYRSLKVPVGAHYLVVNEEIHDSETDHNYPYRKQLEHFFGCIEKGRQSCNSVMRAAKVTELAILMQEI